MELATYVEFFKGLPPELVTLLVAMLPIAELRASIPLALEVFGLPIWSAILWSVIGDMIPATLILLFIEQIVNAFVRGSRPFGRAYQRWAVSTEKKFQSGYAKYGAAVALAIFVGIPLPLTGSWSGALASFLFRIPKPIAFVAIFVGVIIAAVIVTLVDLGIVKFFF